MHSKSDNIEIMSHDEADEVIEELDWVKNKKGTVNPFNDRNKCFQYIATVALNHEEVGNNSQRKSKIKLFISKYNWNRIRER